MTITTIPLSRLEENPARTLSECADSGETLIIELPGNRLVALQPIDPSDDDDLIDRLIASNTRFRDLVAKSKASPRSPF